MTTQSNLLNILLKNNTSTTTGTTSMISYLLYFYLQIKLTQKWHLIRNSLEECMKTKLLSKKPMIYISSCCITKIFMIKAKSFTTNLFKQRCRSMNTFNPLRTSANTNYYFNNPWALFISKPFTWIIHLSWLDSCTIFSLQKSNFTKLPTKTILISTLSQSTLKTKTKSCWLITSFFQPSI